jgi:hypothetical protein
MKLINFMYHSFAKILDIMMDLDIGIRKSEVM